VAVTAAAAAAAEASHPDVNLGVLRIDRLFGEQATILRF
jgi:hypothetical protein